MSGLAGPCWGMGVQESGKRAAAAVLECVVLATLLAACAEATNGAGSGRPGQAPGDSASQKESSTETQRGDASQLVLAPMPDPMSVAAGLGPCSVPSDAGVADNDAGVEVALGSGDLTVLLVFDKSTSMDWPWDHRSRWYAASDAMLAAMEPYLDNLTIAAVMFPQLALCEVAPVEHEVQFDYQPGHQFVHSWLERVCHPHDAWGTPLELAMRHADHAIEQAHDLGLLEDRFRVMLVTDGEPNCEDDPETMVGYAERWQGLGVDTHVIGLPGSESAAALLDQIAEAGGTQAHVSPGTPDEFGDAVQAVLE